MSGKYYIRLRGRKIGPLTVEKLQSLARRGRFGRHYEVSTNGKTWKRAAEFPELFSDDLDDLEGDDGYDGGSDGGQESSDEDDLWSPIDEPKPKAGGRKRRRSRGPSENTEIPVPPYVDPYNPNAQPSGRRKRVRRKSDDGPLPSMPLVDDTVLPELPSEDDTILPSVPFQDDPPPEGEDSGTHQSRANTKKKKEGYQPDFNDDREIDHVEETKKKTGGFFGLFRSKKDSTEELSPHLQLLYRKSEHLRELDFGLEDMVLVGSSQQELSIIGHDDSGDGILTLGLLTLIAFQARSTDIHLEPKADGFDARMRIDGMLVPIVQLPKQVANRLSGVVRVLCEMDFTGQKSIQEGSYSSIAPGRRTDFRVSFTPSIHGKKLAIRILDSANQLQSVKDLGAPKNLAKKLTDVMRQDAGMILMCGPTGSGKTTTLYALIRGIDRKARNVMTIEDPVEYQVEGITQTSVDAKRGQNFSDMLRALLRQDPDVLLLGEIRDAESAKTAMQATMTGHLVLSTVHAQDTLNTVFRLLDLGADPNMVASSLDLVLAQRLVRVLCKKCARRRRPSSDELEKLGRSARDMIYDADGCGRCLGTGYSGRRAIFELLTTSYQLKDVMLTSPTLRQLREAVGGTGFVTLRDHGYQLVGQGLTTFSEIDRVVGLE
jgi:general secretion pathway protein E